MTTSPNNATWKQSSKIWGFCVRKGNENADWAKLAREGNLLKKDASVIVGKIFDKSDVDAAYLIRNYIPGFTLQNNQAEQGEKKSVPVPAPAAKKTVKTVKKTAAKKAESPQEKDEVDQKFEELKQLMQQRKEKEEQEEKKLKARKIKTQGYVKPDNFDEIATLIDSDLQVLLTGPAGCGKSRLFEEVAKCFEMDFFTVSMSGGMRYSQVFGSTHIDNGKSEWKPSEFLKAIQTKGLVFIDEIFSADPEVTLGLNSILEPNSRAVQTPIGKIDVHKECRLAAAANTTGRQVNRQYTGAQRIDDSLLDRFITVPMSYCTAAEKKILKEMGLNAEDITYFTTELKGLREKVRLNNIAFDPSTRRLINCARVFLSGIKKERAFELAFLSGLSKAEQGKI